MSGLFGTIGSCWDSPTDVIFLVAGLLGIVGSMLDKDSSVVGLFGITGFGGFEVLSNDVNESLVVALDKDSFFGGR